MMLILIRHPNQKSPPLLPESGLFRAVVRVTGPECILHPKTSEESCRSGDFAGEEFFGDF